MISSIPTEYVKMLNKSISTLNGTLIGPTTLVLNGLFSNLVQSSGAVEYADCLSA